MNKTIRNTFVAFAAIMGLTLASCTDKYKYQAASASGQQVYFDKVANKISLSKDATSFNVQVRRIATDDAATIALTSTDESGIFTIPGSAAFAAGENVATITIGYNPDVLEYDDFKPITLALADADNTTPYGDAKISFSAGIPSPFVTIGTAKFMDSWMFDDQTYFDVVLQQNEINPDIYRLVNPYDEILVEGGYSPNYVNKGPSESITFQLRHPGEEVGGAILTRSNLVTFEPFRTGYYISNYDTGDADGEVWGFHVSDDTFHESWHVEAAYLKSYVMAYQEDGTPGQIALAPYYYIPGVGGWNKSQDDKQIEIIFPGYTPADYSAEIAYSGIFTDAAGSVFAVANLTLGADAETVKAVVVEESADAAAVADAIASGDLEATDVQGGRIEVPIAEDQSGKLQIIAVVLDGENVKTVVSASFEYYGGGANPWQSLGKATYYEDFIGSVFGIGVLNYEVEIEENSQEPGMYRLINPYENYPANEEGDFTPGSSFNIEINATDPEGVYILKQPIGMDWGYGDMYIQTQGAFYLENGNSYDTVKSYGWFGTLKDKVITFPYGTRDASDGTKVPYGGWLWMGDSRYYGGANQSIAIVLPGANLSSAARRALERNLNANNFERRLNMVPSQKVSKKDYLKSSILLKRQ